MYNVHLIEDLHWWRFSASATMLRSFRTSHVRAILKPPALLPLLVGTLIVLGANVGAFAGYFDFFFGGFGARPQPMAPSWYPDATGLIVKPPVTVRPAVHSSEIEYTSYCVRMRWSLLSTKSERITRADLRGDVSGKRDQNLFGWHDL
jgi:hypothetical protein